MEYRKATMDDIDILIDLRKAQLAEEGQRPDTDIDTPLRVFFHRMLSSGRMVQWLALDGDEIAPTGAVVFYDFPPSFNCVSGRRAYVTNMYTKERYRRQGLASAILDRLVREARNAGIGRVFLSASDMARPVYQKYGFVSADWFHELDL